MRDVENMEKNVVKALESEVVEAKNELNTLYTSKAFLISKIGENILSVLTSSKKKIEWEHINCKPSNAVFFIGAENYPAFIDRVRSVAKKFSTILFFIVEYKTSLNCECKITKNDNIIYLFWHRNSIKNNDLVKQIFSHVENNFICNAVVVDLSRNGENDISQLVASCFSASILRLNEKTIKDLLRAENEMDFLKYFFPSASIIVVNHNKIAFTKMCIDSIINNTVYPFYEILLVDNASNDGSKEYFSMLEADIPALKFISRNVNDGFSGGVNEGLRSAKGDFIVILNNDVIVSRGWLSGLIKHAIKENAGIVGPVTNLCGTEAMIKVRYRTVEEMAAFMNWYNFNHKDVKAFKVKTLNLFCAVMRRDVFEKVGFLDERFSVGMFEDDDYCMRIKEEGFEVICAPNVFVHHFGRVSLLSLLDRKNYRKIFKENRKKFEEKWRLNWWVTRGLSLRLKRIKLLLFDRYY